eukprot:12559027-Alexandrium_andersonii.AAC.1
MYVPKSGASANIVMIPRDAAREECAASAASHGGPRGCKSDWTRLCLVRQLPPEGLPARSPKLFFSSACSADSCSCHRAPARRDAIAA